MVRPEIFPSCPGTDPLTDDISQGLSTVSATAPVLANTSANPPTPTPARPPPTDAVSFYTRRDYADWPPDQILTGSSDRSVRLYNPSKVSPTTDGLIQTYSAHGYEVLDLAVTSDNARFASVGGDKQVFLWDVATARTLRRWSGHFGRVNCVGFGGDGDSVVVSGERPSHSIGPMAAGDGRLGSVKLTVGGDW